MHILASTLQQQASSASVSYSVQKVTPSSEPKTSAEAAKVSAGLQPSSLPSFSAEPTYERLEESAEDAQLAFNHQNTIGTIKRLLEQLNSGEITGWIDLEKLAKAYSQIPANDQTNSEAPLEQFVQEWTYSAQYLSAELNGSANFTDGSALSWAFKFEMSYQEFSYSERIEPPMQDPLTLSFTGRPVELLAQTSRFALTESHSNIRHLGANQFYLAVDSNENGTIDNGAELFGPQTGQGFAELRAYDEDNNGWIDAKDSIWSSLYLWHPEGPMQSLEQMNLLALSVQDTATPFTLRQNDEVLGQLQRSSVFLTQDKKVGLLQQIDLHI